MTVPDQPEQPPPYSVGPPEAPSVDVAAQRPPAPVQPLPRALAPEGLAAPPPIPGAMRARDGRHYIPDPRRPGKFLMVA